MAWWRRGVSARGLRRARAYLRRERPAEGDRWSSGDWLLALRAVGVPEKRLTAYHIAAADIAARNGLLAPSPLVQQVIDETTRRSKKDDQ